VGKVAQEFALPTSGFFKKQLTVNIRPISENSANLVTMDGTFQTKT
jgi:hypothetical protein